MELYNPNKITPDLGQRVIIAICTSQYDKPSYDCADYFADHNSYKLSNGAYAPTELYPTDRSNVGNAVRVHAWASINDFHGIFSDE